MAIRKSYGRRKAGTKLPPKKFLEHKSFSCFLSDYDYDIIKNCSEYGCDDICRCSKIENVRINSIPCFFGEIQSFFKAFGELDHYCIERILNCFGIYDPDFWEPQIGRGYYGEELENFSFNQANEVNSYIDNLLSLKFDCEKINYILKLEYGYILDSIKDKTDWSIKKVDKNLIKFGNEAYTSRLNRSTIIRYEKSTYDMPICVCLPIDDKFKLIDGYHRFSALKNDVKKIKIIC